MDKCELYFSVWLNSLFLFIYIRLKMEFQIKHVFMRLGFLTADLWNGLHGQFQKKMLNVNFVNVILTYQIWMIRHVAGKKHRNRFIGVLLFHAFLAQDIWWYCNACFCLRKFIDMVYFFSFWALVILTGVSLM